MGANIDALKTALTNAATSGAQAAASVLHAGGNIRQGVAGVFLEGVSTNAAIVTAVPIEMAIFVSRRLPFADSQSICAAALNAADDAARFVPYLVTLDTLFGQPGAVVADVIASRYGVPPGAITVAAATAKAAIILTLLADPPDFGSEQDLTTLTSRLSAVSTEATELAKQLFEDVQEVFDPTDLILNKPLDEALIAKLELVKEKVDDFFEQESSTTYAAVGDMLAGIHKVFNAATRGAQRMHEAMRVQHEFLCGAQRRPARGFYRRRPDTISLDRTYPSVAASDRSWALLVSGRQTDLFTVDATSERSRAEFGLSAKTTELTLERRRTSPPPPLVINLPGSAGSATIAAPFASPLDRFAERVRELTVFAESEEITIGERPLTRPVEGRTILLETRSQHLAPNQQIIVTGVDKNGQPCAELAAIAAFPSAVTEVDRRTQIELAEELRSSYVRDSVRINANVAPATHGESIREVLGSGNAATRHQRFTLKQAPVTYVAADTGQGRASTLSVRVNDLLWTEVPTLVGRGPRERVYSTRTDEEGRTTVQFGDGIEGALPPSGPNNVRAGYRKGLGAAGNLAERRLTTLLTRPPGLAGATNPIGAEGGEHPESVDDSRANAPMTVRTLERAVSLTDYEDFATTFAGVGKAQATWVPGSRDRGILLTIAGPDGTVVGDDSATRTKLLAALRKFGDPLLPIDLVSFRPAQFRIKATLIIAREAQPDIVISNVERALARWFSFDRMAFAESISIDDVMAAIHSVEGVVAVDVDRLYRSAPAEAAQWNARLDAAPAGIDPATGALRGAELLTIAPGPYELGFVQQVEVA